MRHGHHVRAPEPYSICVSSSIPRAPLMEFLPPRRLPVSVSIILILRSRGVCCVSSTAAVHRACTRPRRSSAPLVRAHSPPLACFLISAERIDRPPTKPTEVATEINGATNGAAGGVTAAPVP